MDFDLAPGCDNYCVMGNPVAHSLSPAIHAEFARQTGEQIAYGRALVPLDCFPQAVGMYWGQGGKGANVTLPFKQEAWRLSRWRSERAERAGAVNTLWFNDAGDICGDNTDGVGLVRDLIDNLGVKIRGADLLLLGAGGAARGVLPALLAESPGRVVIANRTVSRAFTLAADFDPSGVIEASSYAALEGQQFEGVINATSASLEATVPPLPPGCLRKGGWGYDLMYGAQPTAFVLWTGERRALAADGLGMLVEQAAESFYLWRGVRPATAAVIARFRDPGLAPR